MLSFLEAHERAAEQSKGRSVYVPEQGNVQHSPTATNSEIQLQRNSEIWRCMNNSNNNYENYEINMKLNRREMTKDEFRSQSF